jgi:hypothetical protein
MRFGVLVAVVVAGGALIGATAPVMLDSVSGSIGRSGIVAEAAKIDLSELNPIKLIYDDVMKQVTDNANRPSFAVGTPVPVADFSKMDDRIRTNNENFRRMSNPGDVGQLPE